MNEHQLQQLLINYLRVKKWYVMRLNSGKYAVGEGRSKRFIMGQDAGTPDIMAFKGFLCHGCEREAYEDDCSTQLLFIEVKTLKNKKPTDLQTRKMAELEEYGATCLVIHSLAELQAEGI